MANTYNRPSVQVILSESELEAEVPPRVLLPLDPRAPENIASYSLGKKRFDLSTNPRPLVVHFCMEGSVVRKDALNSSSKTEDARIESTDSLSSVPKTGLIYNPLRDQIRFIDRPSQTSNPAILETGFSTQPPPSCDYNITVSQSLIADAFLKLTPQQGDLVDTVGAKDAMYSNGMKSAAKLMERMVNFNQESDAYRDLKFFVDDADKLREEGSLLPLWRFVYEKTAKKQVTCVRWNPKYADMFAVSFGSYEFLKQSSGGAIVVYSLKNPKHPEHFVTTECTVCSIDWNKFRPAILSVGLYDGSVAVIDVRSKARKLVFKTSAHDHKHSDPVWEVKWLTEDTFVSVSVDGRVCCWTLKRSGFEEQTISELKAVVTDEQLEGYLPRLMSGLCICFSDHEEGIFLVGTEEGDIHKYSRLVQSKGPLSVFKGHSMAVYAVKWSPFNPEVFISSSADWTVKLWRCTNASGPSVDPIGSFDLKHAVGDIDWSPVSSTTFGAVTAEGSIVVFDLSVNMYKPVANQKVVSKGKLTRLEFNPKSPLVVIGDDRGGTSCLKLSPNLIKSGDGSEPDKLAKIIKILSQLSN